MNSEELEQSLRAEFESYLKGVLGDMREDVNEFQKKIEAEIDKHRSQLDEAFRSFSARFDAEAELDQGFKETVVEHLRLARDEGAKITATAIAEAEELEKAARPELNLNELRDAINDISSKDSQSSILKSLITHAAAYTPRGAFFIIKNEHFVGWKVFGKEAPEGETAIREVHFPVGSDSILGGAVRALSTVEGSFGTYADDGSFLDPLHFGSPDRMYAMPLVARGRGVAVLYCDYGHEGVTVNTDALEMLVRVAGLTVELLASSKALRVESQHAADTELSEAHHDEAEAHEVQHEEAAPHAFLHEEHAHEEPAAPAEHFESAAEEVAPTPSVFAEPFPAPAAEPETVTAFEPPVFEAPEAEASTTDFVFTTDFGMAPEYTPEVSEAPETPTFETAEFESTQPVVDFDAVSEPVHTALDETSLSDELRSYQPEEPVAETPVTEPAIVFEPTSPVESIPFEASPFDKPVEQFEPAGMSTGSPVLAPAAPVVEAIPSRPTGTRLSDRHVDLPIEVAEDERRLHNDARRFARLLVSEIKLYNEKKVQEGRESSDLYDRLREAIDRSREMYDKRVQPAVATKFDYFHYELVNSLAEGDETRLGSSYKGATV